MLRCTVCAVSIDVEFASTPVSPLVPRRHLLTWAIPFMTASPTHTKGSEGGFDLVYALVLRARDEAKCSFGRLNNDGAG